MAHDQQDALAWAVGAFRNVDQAARYHLSARYLDGDQALAFSTLQYDSVLSRIFAAFAYNRCMSVVEAFTSRLDIEGFTADDETVAERAMEVWDRNEMPGRINELMVEGFSAGDSYLLTWPDDEGRATIWPQQAAHIRVHYSDERPGLVTAATKTWTLHDGRMRLNVYTPNLIERYVTRTKAYSGIPASSRAFEPYEDDAPAITTHPWGIPVAHYANNGRTGAYGRSELRDVIPLQDAINETLTDMLVAIKLMAYPQRVILGMDNPDPGAGEAIQKFVAGMSRILTLSGGASIDQFMAADLAQFVNVAEFLDLCVARVSKVPVHYLTLSGSFPSGRALRTAEAPFVAKLEDRQRSIASTVEDAMTTALAIEGVPDPAGLTVVWASAAPLAQDDIWEIAIQKRAAGLPFQQILIEAGYQPDEVDAIQAMVADAGEVAVRAFNAGAFSGDDDTDVVA